MLQVDDVGLVHALESFGKDVLDALERFVFSIDSEASLSKTPKPPRNSWTASRKWLPKSSLLLKKDLFRPALKH